MEPYLSEQAGDTKRSEGDIIPIALDPKPRLGALPVRGAELVLAAAAEPDHLGPRRRGHAVLGAEVADPAPRRRDPLDVDDHRIRREHGGGDRRRGAGRRGPGGDAVSPHA